MTKRERKRKEKRHGLEKHKADTHRQSLEWYVLVVPAKGREREREASKKEKKVIKTKRLTDLAYLPTPRRTNQPHKQRNVRVHTYAIHINTDTPT